MAVALHSFIAEKGHERGRGLFEGNFFDRHGNWEFLNWCSVYVLTMWPFKLRAHEVATCMALFSSGQIYWKSLNVNTERRMSEGRGATVATLTFLPSPTHADTTPLLGCAFLSVPIRPQTHPPRSSWVAPTNQSCETPDTKLGCHLSSGFCHPIFMLAQWNRSRAQC